MWEKKVFSIVTTHAVGPGEEWAPDFEFYSVLLSSLTKLAAKYFFFLCNGDDVQPATNRWVLFWCSDEKQVDISDSLLVAFNGKKIGVGWSDRVN